MARGTQWTLREWQETVITDGTLVTAARLFAFYLSLRADADMVVVTNIVEVCNAIKISSTTVVQANQALEACGYIRRSVVHRTGTKYQLLMPGVDEPTV